MKRFLPLLIFTGLLFGQGWTRHSGVERNDVFKQYNTEPHEIDPTVFNNSNFRHLNTIRTQRDDWLQLSLLGQNWDDSVWVNNYQNTLTYDMYSNNTGRLSQNWDDR